MASIASDRSLTNFMNDNDQELNFQIIFVGDSPVFCQEFLHTSQPHKKYPCEKYSHNLKKRAINQITFSLTTRVQI